MGVTFDAFKNLIVDIDKKKKTFIFFY